MSKPAKFVATYLGVLILMLTWWSTLRASGSVGQIWLVAAAYGVLLAVWGVLLLWGRSQEKGTR
ncbi:hypothetical protein BMS3Abin02_01286 [bacterium BMS3Abin02]|nr:hypothetical protein BMS3Abin02_01286 [bacterium BMS3Abin02]GBE22343.1 hypothetical protein BMS3Bbin01_01715 [bacterium BMS3Bbin01]HDH27324.1 hypothetical protein [Actinomycetota bacterium]